MRSVAIVCFLLSYYLSLWQRRKRSWIHVVVKCIKILWCAYLTEELGNIVIYIGHISLLGKENQAKI
jgi:hypothetical protein